MSIRRRYDEDLRQIEQALGAMGEAAIEAVNTAVALLEHKNTETARAIIEGDEEIDAMEKSIEHQCLELLLRQQPMASDLRRVSTALKLVTDIERIGDHAADLAEISESLEDGWQKNIPVQDDIQKMASTSLDMVRAAISAFVAEDDTGARIVIRRDDEVDALFDRVKNALAAYIAQNPSEIDAALDLLMVIKYLERLGDHAVNVAEWVGFLKTGCYRGQQIV